jgi:hypothetical protein
LTIERFLEVKSNVVETMDGFCDLISYHFHKFERENKKSRNS